MKGAGRAVALSGHHDTSGFPEYSRGGSTGDGLTGIAAGKVGPETWFAWSRHVGFEGGRKSVVSLDRYLIRCSDNLLVIGVPAAIYRSRTRIWSDQLLPSKK